MICGHDPSELGSKNRCKACRRIAWGSANPRKYKPKRSAEEERRISRERARAYRADPVKAEAMRQYVREYRSRHEEREKARNRAYNRRRAGIVNPSGETKSGPCEICGTPKDRLHYDHDHSTGEFRGWLCGTCNRGLGCFRDDSEALGRAISYLRERGAQ